MNKLILISILLLFSLHQNAQTIDILIIGNSGTFYNDGPLDFQSLAEASGKDLNVESVAEGGYSLSDHLQNPPSLQKLASKEWDYVILQDYPALRYEENSAVFLQRVEEFKALIYSNYNETKILYYMWYAPMRGYYNTSGNYVDYDDTWDEIYDASIDIANYHNIDIAPIGFVWNDVFVDDPNFELYLPDFNHPTEYGTYLISCVYFNRIFQEEITNSNTYYSNISSTDARYLRNFSNDLVLNNMNLWVVKSEELLNERKEILLYPNPSSGKIYIQHIEFENGNCKLEVLNLNGQKIYSEPLNKMQLSNGVNLNVPNGVYFVQIVSDKIETQNKIIIY